MELACLSFPQLDQPGESPAPTSPPSAAPAVTKSICNMPSTVGYFYNIARTLLSCSDLTVDLVFPYQVLDVSPSPPPSPSRDEAAEAAIMAPSKLPCHPYCFGWWLIQIQSTRCLMPRILTDMSVCVCRAMTSHHQATNLSSFT